MLFRSEMLINEARRPLDLIPLERTVADPSLETKLSCNARSLPSSVAFDLDEEISFSRSEFKSRRAFSRFDFALSNSPSSPGSPASSEAI